MTISEGTVVVVDTGQAGTIIDCIQGMANVLLANGNIWRGQINRVHEPMSHEELAAAVLDIDPFVHREKKRIPKKMTHTSNEFQFQN